MWFDSVDWSDPAMRPESPRDLEWLSSFSDDATWPNGEFSADHQISPSPLTPSMASTATCAHEPGSDSSQEFPISVSSTSDVFEDPMFDKMFQINSCVSGSVRFDENFAPHPTLGADQFASTHSNELDSIPKPSKKRQRSEVETSVAEECPNKKSKRGQEGACQRAARHGCPHLRHDLPFHLPFFRGDKTCGNLRCDEYGCQSNIYKSEWSPAELDRLELRAFAAKDGQERFPCADHRNTIPSSQSTEDTKRHSHFLENPNLARSIVLCHQCGPEKLCLRANLICSVPCGNDYHPVRFVLYLDGVPVAHTDFFVATSNRREHKPNCPSYNDSNKGKKKKKPSQGVPVSRTMQASFCK